MMCKVCLAIHVLLLSSWALNQSLVLAQTNSTSALHHQERDIDHSANRRTREYEQFSTTKQGNASQEIIRHRDEEATVSLLDTNLYPLDGNADTRTKLNNYLSRKKRALNNCVLHGGEMFNSGTAISIKTISTTLHVQANRPFTLDIEVSVSNSFDQKLTVSSDFLGISSEIEWNSITVELSSYQTVVRNWKLEVKYGVKLKELPWSGLVGSQFNSMTITVTDCIAWYYGVVRHSCPSPTTQTTSSRPTTPTTKRTTTTTGTASDDERELDTDRPGTVPQQTVDPLYWLLVLPLVAVVALVVALCCFQKRKNYKRKVTIALAIETAIQPRVRHESINSLYGVVHKPVQRYESINSIYESNDVQLNPACGTGTWSPSSRDFCGTTSQEENLYAN